MCVFIPLRALPWQMNALGPTVLFYVSQSTLSIPVNELCQFSIINNAKQNKLAEEFDCETCVNVC